MKAEFLEIAFRAVLRMVLPLVLALLSMAVFFLPTPDFALARFAPAIPLVFVFYYSVHRPGVMPYWLAFLLGLAADLWAAGPLGLNALLLFLMVAIIAPQERFFRSITFPVIWLIFVLFALIWLVAHWAVESLFYFKLLSPWELIFQIGLAIVLYPVLSRLLAIFDGYVIDGFLDVGN